MGGKRCVCIRRAPSVWIAARMTAGCGARPLVAKSEYSCMRAEGDHAPMCVCVCRMHVHVFRAHVPRRPQSTVHGTVRPYPVRSSEDVRTACAVQGTGTHTRYGIAREHVA